MPQSEPNGTPEAPSLWSNGATTMGNGVPSPSRSPQPASPSPTASRTSTAPPSHGLRARPGGAPISELRTTAAGIVPPIGAVDVCCLVDDDRAYRAAFLVDGIRKEPVGPSFADPRDASRLADILRGEIR